MGKEDARAKEQDGASPGKIFIGGLPKDTSQKQFVAHFGKYGEIIDSVIMVDRVTRQPRGFGFITYANPSVVDKVIEDTHVFNGKQVEIKRTIPKGSSQSKDFKTKKIFVGGIPSTLTEDELKDFFSKYGKVVDHQIMRDHSTNRSRGFGFIVFDSEQVVDDLLVEGNMIDLAGSKVEIKKAEPKKPNPPPAAFGRESRARSFGDEIGGFGGSYSGYGGGFGPTSYRTSGGLGPRIGGYGSYGVGSEFGGPYGGYGSGLGAGELGGYRGESSLGYSSRFGSYGGGGYGGYGAGSLGGYGRGDEGFGGYGGSRYGGGYDSGAGGGYGSGGLYGSRGGGYSGPGRYHPYAR